MNKATKFRCAILFGAYLQKNRLYSGPIQCTSRVAWTQNAKRRIFTRLNEGFQSPDTAIFDSMMKKCYIPDPLTWRTHGHVFPVPTIVSGMSYRISAHSIAFQKLNPLRHPQSKSFCPMKDTNNAAYSSTCCQLLQSKMAKFGLMKLLGLDCADRFRRLSTIIPGMISIFVGDILNH